MLSNDALYYPYINVRSVNWLKATLLCFPHVLRMVPENYLRNELPEMREFSEIVGASDRPLLQGVNVLDPTYEMAQYNFVHRLTSDFDRDPDFFLREFSRDRAFRDHGSGGDWFVPIHRGKFSPVLKSFLFERQLAWQPTHADGANHTYETYQRRRRDDDWILVHPRLGQAIMSTIAAVVAAEQGCDILTELGSVHSALASKQTAAIYDHFIRGELSQQVDNNPTNSVIQFVFMTKFNLDALSAADVAKLSQEREGLYQLKEAVKPMLKHFPSIAGDARKYELLKEASELVVSEWRKKSASFSSLAKGVFSADTIMSQDVANYVAAGASSGAMLGSMGFTVLSAGAGLVVGVILQTVQRYRSLTNSPYKFLTTLEANGATVIASA